MAAESIQHMYLYTPNPLSFRKATKPVFFHNAIHDMESIFWVIYGLVLNVESQVQEARDEIINMLFTGWKRTAATRWTFVSYTSMASEHYDTLFGEDRAELLEKLFGLNIILTRYYKELEANIPSGPVDISKLSGIHKEFCGVWMGCMVCSSKQDIHLSTSLSQIW